MSYETVPVQLNKGLDLTTAPLLTEPGTLIDCLNYELIDGSGYRKIDGYERYDGYPGGAVYSYYVLTLVADNPANQGFITTGVTVGFPGTDRYAIPNQMRTSIGSIVDSHGSNSYSFVPYTQQGLLAEGETVVIRALSGATFTATMTGTLVEGQSLVSGSQYLANLREYSEVLRGLVIDADTSIAGLMWFQDKLYAAVDAISLTYTNTNVLFPIPGSYITHKGTVYQVLEIAERDVDGVANRIELIVRRYASTTTTDSIVEVDNSGYTHSTVYGTSVDPIVGVSEWAYLVKFPDPTYPVRTIRALYPVVKVPFDAGSYSSETLPVGAELKFSSGISSVAGYIVSVHKESGSFLAGTAAGYMMIEMRGQADGRSAIRDNYDIRIFPGGSTIAVVNDPTGLAIIGPKIAGTGLLHSAGTRYQSLIANFYGQESTRTGFGVTGASRGFWFNDTTYGVITTQDDETLDMPKYLAVHQLRLTFGFAGGSVQRSVAGEPLNFSGLDGADEYATGDNVTGLLELNDDSLIIFGKRSIKRLIGSTSTDTRVSNISSNSGCFDYTAVLVGTSPVFTGVTGISTLEQTQKYGDFLGERISGNISAWLRPKLLTDEFGFETGGVAMAMEVRSKNQYRLFLKDGTVVVATLGVGPLLCTWSNYGFTGDLRVPLAWSSAMSDSGKEQLHVVWDEQLAARGNKGQVGTLPLPDRVYALDQGWGFDGEYFNHYFDTTHVFRDLGTRFTGIAKARLYGQGYGLATLNIKAAGIEEDFLQEYCDSVQDISIPRNFTEIYDRMKQMTGIVELANWGLGIKLRIQNTIEEGSSLTEPSHLCQVLVLHMRAEGATDG